MTAPWTFGAEYARMRFADRRARGVGLATIVDEAPTLATIRRPAEWLRPDDSKIKHAGNRLCLWAGLERRRFLELFDRTCLLSEPTRTWPLAGVRERADELRPILLGRGGPVVLLGRRVADAFGFSGDAFPTWYRWAAWADPEDLDDPPLESVDATDLVDLLNPLGRAISREDLRLAAALGIQLVAVVPHPSPWHREWKDPDAADRARCFWTSLAVVLEARAEVLWRVAGCPGDFRGRIPPAVR